jgi:hypothetical protein
MSAPSGCNPCCSTTATTQIPGPAGADATPIAPDVVDPTGVKVATFAGQTYLNSSTQSFWIATAVGSASWLKLIGVFAFLFFTMSAMALPPILRGPTTTNTPSDTISLLVTNADSRIALDTTKQPAKSALTNLVAGDGSVLSSNVSPAALSGMKFTGIVTNKSTLSTNIIYFSNGIVTNASLNP